MGSPQTHTNTTTYFRAYYVSREKHENEENFVDAAIWKAGAKSRAAIFWGILAQPKVYPTVVLNTPLVVYYV